MNTVFENQYLENPLDLATWQGKWKMAHNDTDHGIPTAAMFYLLHEEEETDPLTDGRAC